MVVYISLFLWAYTSLSLSLFLVSVSCCHYIFPPCVSVLGSLHFVFYRSLCFYPMSSLLLVLFLAVTASLVLIPLSLLCHCLTRSYPHLPALSQLFVIDHNQLDWRIAMTRPRVLGISLELLVCTIHPVVTYWWSPAEEEVVEEEVDASSLSQLLLDGDPPKNFSAPLCLSTRSLGPLRDVEILLTAMMFLRLYLVHRTILLHSKVLLNASYRTIGSLNKINFSFRFLLKVLMNKYPARTLLAFIVIFWILASWTLTLCER